MRMMAQGRSLDALVGYLEKACQRYGRLVDGEWVFPSDPQAAERDVSDAAAPPTVAEDEEEERASPEAEAAWEQAATLHAEGQIVTAMVTGWNRGGLLVRWGELQGFVPASQLKEVPLCDDDARDEKLARWVGEELALKVIELDRHRNRLVFSERATMWGPKDGDRVLAELAPGETRRGCVSNLCDFGAFVDLGGVDGLIHLSELSWSRVSDPKELLRIGQEVEVYVISVDRENRRVALSLKRLQPDPWTLIDETCCVGDVIPATITNVVDFGAFAQISEGLEGLIHISELDEEKVGHPAEVVQPGERVNVRVLRIDSANHRLALSLRQAERVDGADVGATDTGWNASSALT